MGHSKWGHKRGETKMNKELNNSRLFNNKNKSKTNNFKY
jgi:hypothetical protein